MSKQEKFGAEATSEERTELLHLMEKIVDIMPDPMSKEDVRMWMGAFSAMLRLLVRRGVHRTDVIGLWDEMVAFHRKKLIQELGHDD